MHCQNPPMMALASIFMTKIALRAVAPEAAIYWRRLRGGVAFRCKNRSRVWLTRVPPPVLALAPVSAPAKPAAPVRPLPAAARLRLAASYDDSKHPRGQPDNAGQFGPGGGGGASTDESDGPDPRDDLDTARKKLDAASTHLEEAQAPLRALHDKKMAAYHNLNAARSEAKQARRIAAKTGSEAQAERARQAEAEAAQHQATYDAIKAQAAPLEAKVNEARAVVDAHELHVLKKSGVDPERAAAASEKISAIAQRLNDSASEDDEPSDSVPALENASGIVAGFSEAGHGTAYDTPEQHAKQLARASKLLEAAAKRDPAIAADVSEAQALVGGIIDRDRDGRVGEAEKKDDAA
jgi:hypothetical protein